MDALSRLRDKFARSKKYRESFAASIVKRMIPLQIRVLRKQRGWSQAKLAVKSDLTQGVISRAEDPEYGNLTVNTLIRIGAGFDCAYVGRYVPFSELGKWYADLDNEKSLEVPSFDSDTGFIERKQPGSYTETRSQRTRIYADGTGGMLNAEVIPGGSSSQRVQRDGSASRGSLIQFELAQTQEREHGRQ